MTGFSCTCTILNSPVVLLGILDVGMCVCVLPARGTSAVVVKIFTVLRVILCTSVAPFIRGSQKALLDIHTKLQNNQEEENVILNGVVRGEEMGVPKCFAPSPEHGVLGRKSLPANDTLLPEGWPQGAAALGLGVLLHQTLTIGHPRKPCPRLSRSLQLGRSILAYPPPLPVSNPGDTISSGPGGAWATSRS